MNALRSQKKIAWTLLALCVVIATTNAVLFLGRISRPDFVDSMVYGVGLILLLGVLAFWVAQIDSVATRIILILFFLLPSGPATGSGSASFVGMWMLIIALVLIVKIDPVPKHRLWLIGGASLYYLPWLFSLAVNESGGIINITRVINYAAFLGVAVATLYFLFEEEIRDLLASNKQKDVEIAKKDAEIARLEPLSTLGERVAHVAHSFKNNLSLLGTAQFHLEQGGDVVKAARKIEEFSRTMNERIDNILMVSRASAEQTAEVFDAARVLAGLNQVYLSEPAFLQRATVELEANEPTPVWGVRWDFLLMAENILKNALEALDTKGEFGSIKLSLKDRRLTFANNGGAMALCSDCRNDCLSCTRYGRPGQTTKAMGSGHGLAQVFGTCRQYGWTLRIRTHEDWTIFEVGLVKPTAEAMALGGAPNQRPSR